MCGAVGTFSCLDTTAKYLGRHIDIMQVVWARYTFGFLLALETGLLGLFASLDIILFYIFFEFTLIPLFFLIGIWGGPQRRRASVTFFLF